MHDATGHEPSQRRVFLSYAYNDMEPWALALRESLRRKGAVIVGDNPNPVGNLRRYYADAVNSANLMVLLLRPGDERRQWIEHETQLMLQACWKNSRSRIAVLAPTVETIPRALRYQEFVDYYTHEYAKLSQWTNQSTVDTFTEILLAAQGVRSTANLESMSDQEIKAWRNRLLHIRPYSLRDNPAERERVVTQLRKDLELFKSTLATPEPVDTDKIERLLDCALIAAHLGEAELVAQYYELLSRERTDDAPSDETYETAPQRDDEVDTKKDSYRLGIVAYEAGDYNRAKDLFEESLQRATASYGPEHPTTVQNISNLALSYSQLGETARARELFERALKRSRASLGDLHPLTGEIAYNLGLVLSGERDFERARVAFRIATRSLRAVRPEDSVELAELLEHIDALRLSEDE